MPCIPFKANRSFGGIFRLHLQCLRISQAKKQAGSKQNFLLHGGASLGLFFDPEESGDVFLRNFWLA
jgi:hypothetical protein